MDPSKSQQQRSSAVTLSDMELFIFPELMYGLVLANIMSPRIWRWRDDPWFSGLEEAKPYRRISRLKQYIMDHYVFNLDLNTWGLTTKPRELARFEGLVDEQTLARSNALFGYEGDAYYFDIDIRRHFGLDQYVSEVIPYWKTETVEAMDAFRHRPGYATGAGECVSLAALYAAALFIVARIPLSEIVVMATPLHSQNFIDVDDGVLTNNRRLVTKNMWFNGTALSAQARRALENERVTIVAHETGYVHTLYRRATIDPAAYDRFAGRLRGFLTGRFSSELLGSFLRHDQEHRKCFQVRWARLGKDHYINLERVLAYEHGCPYRFDDNTRKKLMAEIDAEEFFPSPFPRLIVINDLEAFIQEVNLQLDSPRDVALLKERFSAGCLDAKGAIDSLIRFCKVEPQLPDAALKTFEPYAEPLGIDLEMTREQIISRLEGIREQNEFASLAFYAYRDLNRTEAMPFLVAAVQRNPVSLEGSKTLDEVALFSVVDAFDNHSIYDDTGRLAQPDEVWNYRRGDGVEKALLLANILRQRMPAEAITLEVGPHTAVLRYRNEARRFESAKGLTPCEWRIP